MGDTLTSVEGHDLRPMDDIVMIDCPNGIWAAHLLTKFATPDLRLHLIAESYSPNSQTPSLKVGYSSLAAC